MSPRARAWVAAVLAVVAIVSLLISRAHHAGMRELQAAEAALAAQDLDGAIIHYRRAGSWWWPLSPTAARAVQALQTLADEARQQQDAARELLAVRAWFSALMSRRWLVPPAQVQQVAERLSALSVRLAPVSLGDSRSASQRTAALQQQLLAQQAPRPLGLVFALVGFACWVGAALRMPQTGFDAELRPTAAARTLGTWIVVGFGLFVLGLALA